MALLLKGARLVDPRIPIDEVADLLIRDGQIVEVGKNLKMDKGDTVDLKDRVIVPGFVDMHVHLREPGYEYKETIESGTRAAVHGGFTAVCAMPNTDPVIDTGATVESVMSRAEEEAHCRVFQYGAITQGQKGKRLAEMADMLAAGTIAFSDDGHGLQSSKMTRTAMEYASTFDVPLVLHCEDESLVGDACVHEGEVSTRLGMKGSPSLAESLAVARDIALASLTGCPIHICHISSQETVEVIKEAKYAGVEVSCEVTPHHLLLIDEALDDSFDTMLKMNPPLRSESDRTALIGALKDGTIDCIASDHAPHAPHEKDREFDLASYGTIGLETTVPLMLDRLVSTNAITLEDLIERLSYGPREALRLADVSLQKGSVADLTILDLDREVEFTLDYFQGRSKNSAFLGQKAKGCATDVLVGGYWALREGEVTW
ncbi:MAG: dihydroorotase [Coriobacteriia bacterium]|nr:dihydroorotase [Coriobacteriia bacterium]